MCYRTLLAICVSASLVFLSACSHAADSPYMSEYAAAEKANENNPFVRQVFANALSAGVIKAADYNESIKRLQKCYEDKGLTVFSSSDQYGLGITDFSFVADELNQDSEAAIDACNQEFNGTAGYAITDLYYQQLSNPQKQDLNQLIADCFVRKGLAPKGFDAQDYREFVIKNSAECTNGKCVLPDGTEVSADNIPARTGDFILPGGKSADTHEAGACRFAPLKD